MLLHLLNYVLQYLKSKAVLVGEYVHYWIGLFFWVWLYQNLEDLLIRQRYVLVRFQRLPFEQEHFAQVRRYDEQFSALYYFNRCNFATNLIEFVPSLGALFTELFLDHQTIRKSEANVLI